MINLRTQRIRITGIIFALVTAIIGILVWAIIATSHTNLKKGVVGREEVFLDLIALSCRSALITDEFDEAQLFVDRISQSPYIDQIYLTNSRNVIVVSSSFADIGTTLQQHVLTGETWTVRPLTNQSGTLGSLAVRFNRTEFTGAIRSMWRITLILAPIGMLVTAGVSWLLGTYLTRRLEALEKTAQAISDGTLSARADERGGDEISRLGIAFNKMTHSLLKTMAALQASENRYRNFSSLTSDFVHCCSRRGESTYRIDWMGGAFEAITGFSKEDIFSKGCLMQFAHPEDIERISQALMELTPGDRSTETFRVIKGSGETCWLKMQCHCEQGTLPDELVLYGTMQDITEQKRAEEAVTALTIELENRVQERTGQLQTAMDEIESFNYSVSHDLRTPLRHMAGYSRILLDDYHDRLDAVGVGYLERIEHAGIRMGQIIDALLQLSRIGRAPLRLEQVNLSRMAVEIAEDLRAFTPERAVQVEIAKGITVNADTSLMQIVLQNLIGNAWKYSRDADPAYISLAAERHDGTLVYCLRDNGAGFDMAYADKLFAPFQRLHSPTDFDGNGIGLATVHRIINRHGGTIWAESEQGKGAAFYFTLC